MPFPWVVRRRLVCEAPVVYRVGLEHDRLVCPRPGRSVGRSLLASRQAVHTQRAVRPAIVTWPVRHLQAQGLLPLPAGVEGVILD